MLNAGERSSGWFPAVPLGHCRTSTAGQNPDRQIDALLRDGVDRDDIHVDVAGGSKASRPERDLVMQPMRGATRRRSRLDRGPVRSR
ncbi:hypothetical protein [Streptomyces sp. MJP52]|uniref:hypothetical protein n=1 Tax=Streptomyces sp. MJP52 TaxID=2940555 RepID=UPI0024732B62|nr:hypothetical protein [Streptomyces sp. MJP52]MDH6229134.1 hypothetical protein [Streptomyces sp. MJP52]